jgi:hypothetical protein
MLKNLSPQENSMKNYLLGTKLGRYVALTGAGLAAFFAVEAQQPDSVDIGGYRIPAEWNLALRKMDAAIESNNKDVIVGQTDYRKLPCILFYGDENFNPKSVSDERIEPRAKAADANKNGKIEPDEFCNYCKNQVEKFYDDMHK